MAKEIEGDIEKAIKEEKKEDRPLMGYKKEKLLDMCEKHRDLFNDSISKEDREYHKKKISEIETELKSR